MANVTMSKFLGDWTKSITKPLEGPKKPVPELSCSYLGYAGSDFDNIEVYYTGDGDVTLVAYLDRNNINPSEPLDRTEIANSDFADGKRVVRIPDVWDVIILTSTETDNYASATYEYTLS